MLLLNKVVFLLFLAPREPTTQLLTSTFYLFVSAKPPPAVNREATQKASRPWVPSSCRAGPTYKRGKLLGSRGARQQCQCSERTGRDDQLGTGEGRAGTGRARSSSVLVLTDNIERVNQRVQLIPHALQGVADGLGAVQELDAVGVGLVFHREGPLDVRRVAPAREGCTGWVQEMGAESPSYTSPLTQQDTTG